MLCIPRIRDCFLFAIVIFFLLLLFPNRSFSETYSTVKEVDTFPYTPRETVVYTQEEEPSSQPLRNQLEQWDKHAITLSGGLTMPMMFGSYITKENTSLRGGSLLFSYLCHVGYTWQFHRNFGVQSGFSIVSKGNSTKVYDTSYSRLLVPPLSTSTSITAFKKRSIKTFEIPLMFKVRAITRADRQFLNFSVGASWCRVISAKENVNEITTIETKDIYLTTSSNTSEDEIYERDLLKDELFYDRSGHTVHYTFNDFYNKVDISLLANLGYEFKLDPIGFFINCNYSRSLVNFIDMSESAEKEIRDYVNPHPLNGYQYFSIEDPQARFRNISLVVGMNIWF